MCKVLCCYSEQLLAQIFLCHYPLNNESAPQEWMISDFSHLEFGDIAYFYLTHNYNKSYCSVIVQQCYHECQNKLQEQQIELEKKS